METWAASHAASQSDKTCVCRSVTMDAWSDEQLNKMRLGGNERVNDFLKQCGVPKETPIAEKYNSKGAAVRSLLL